MGLFEGALLVVALGALGYGHLRVWRGRGAGDLALLLALDAVAGVLVAVASFAPARFEAWMQEDAWAEWATFYAFLLAGVGWLRRLSPVVTTGEGAALWLSRLALLGAGLFCLFVAGEEISWAQRVLALEPPDIFLEENFQQELNVHNLLKERSLLSFELETKNLVVLVALSWGVALPALGAWLRERGWVRAVASAAPPPALAGFFLLVAWAEIAYPISLTGEAAELVLGVTLLVGVGLLAPGAPGPRAAVLRAAPVPLVIGAGLLTPLLLQHLVYAGDEERTARAREELHLLAADLEAGAARPKLFKKRKVHKRVFTAARDGYLRFDDDSRFLEGRGTPADADAREPRRDRRGYFIDPWGNPYWLHASKKRGRVILYSFGEDRRRDVEPDAKVLVPGDDVVVEVEGL